MNSFTVAFLFLVVALATATDVDTKSMKTRFLGDVPTSGTLNVPVVKNKGSGNPSPDVTSLLRSITPKSTGDEKKKEEKVHSRTIGNIPKGLWGGASRDGSSIVDSPGDSAGSDSTGESCSAKVSLSFDGDSYSNSDNGMILFDSATYDSETGSFSGDRIWSFGIGDFSNGSEYNLDDCLEENVCYMFMFVGE
jgi:hypothetical protein